MMEPINAGDRYYLRRLSILNMKYAEWLKDPVIMAMMHLDLRNLKVLEIGCSNGWRLERIRENLGCECYGTDVAMLPVQSCEWPIRLSVGSASALSYDDGSFDVVIFGHCLYLCEPSDYFSIAAEGDRVLRDEGYMVIHDFYPKVRCYNTNPDDAKRKTHKMDFTEMFTWHPCYKMVHRNITTDYGLAGDNLITAVLKKKGDIYG